MDADSPIRFLNLEYFFVRIADLFGNFGEWVTSITFSFDGFLKAMGILISIIVIFLVGLVTYLYLRRREQEAERSHRIKNYYVRYEPTEVKTNERWEVVENHFRSDNEAEWRVAIIEADAMLEDLFLELGYPGDNLGERMRAASPANFPTIQQAWEAHKMRNRIAHDGLNYKLDKQEALRAWKLYENVFADAGVI